MALAIVTYDVGAGVSAKGTQTIVASSVVRVRNDTGGFAEPRHFWESVAEFPLPAGCIVRARLDLGKASSGFPDEAVSVYPSNLSLTARAADGTPRAVSALTLLDNRPRALVTVTGGTASADVTATARLWQAGGPFPSQGDTVAAGSPLALDIDYSDLTDGHFDVTFAKPSLQLSLAPGGSCAT